MTNYQFFLPRLLIKQKGQAMVYVLVFMPVLILSVLMIYNSGKLIDEKMKLQNAADATAYSISLLEARDLNFTAYTNRAMIGNELAIAQFVGLFSWFDQIGSSMKFFNLYVIIPMDAVAASASAASLGILAPIMATIVAILKAVKAVVDAAVQVVKNVLKSIIKIATQVMGMINFVYNTAQLTMHYATLFLSLSVLEKTIPDNAPGAKLSDFGLFSFISHAATYYANPLNEKTFVHSNSSTDTSETGKVMRHQYAATINASRDDFSLNRGGGYDFELIPFPAVSFGINVNLAVAKVTGSFFFDMGVDLRKRGGTDLRYKSVGKKEIYSWTGVDTADMNFWWKLQLSLSFKLCLPIIGCFSPFPSFSTPNSVPFVVNLPAPFGAGAGQVSGPGGTMNSADMYGVDGAEYGKAPSENPTAYNFFFIPPDIKGIPMKMPTEGVIYTGHKGLPRYNSAADPKIMADLVKKHPKMKIVEELGFFAPDLIIGVVKDNPDIRTSEKILNTSSGKQFHLDNPIQDNEVAAIAKSQVYFSRPLDSMVKSYFSRVDGKTEYGSTYNPFWQARLVNLEIPDKVIALLIQQRQVWAVSGVTLALPFGLGSFDLNQLLKKMGII